jgi:hypothetical protein
MLWPQDKAVGTVTRLLDDEGPDSVARWGGVIARAAAEVRATTAVIVMEGWTAPPPGLRDERQETLIVAAADADGREVIVEMTTALDDTGRRRVQGESVVRPEVEQFSIFEPLRAVWRLHVSRPPSA